VKVTCWPWQTANGGFWEMLTDGVTTGSTVMVNEFEVTGLVTGQGMLEVSLQVTVSPLPGV